MNRKLRILLAVGIALAPTHGLRRLLYRALLGYRLDPTARIGWRTIVAVASFEAGAGVIVDRYNIFRGPMAVRLGRGCRIGRHNRFTCPWNLTDPKHAAKGYAPALVMGDEALIVDKHELDLYGTVTFGARACFAGAGTIVYTHGLTVTDRNVTIGDDTYVGAASRFAPGTRIGAENVVALGSVILTKIDVTRHLIAGSPARPVWSIAEEIESGRYYRSTADW